MMPDAIYQMIFIFRANGPAAEGCRQMPGNKPFAAALAMLEASHGPPAPGAAASICRLPGVCKHTRSVLREVPGDAGQTQNA
jgi:hypothetical protein